MKSDQMISNAERSRVSCQVEGIMGRQEPHSPYSSNGACSEAGTRWREMKLEQEYEAASAASEGSGATSHLRQ
jgi:hypothetical protein